MLSDILVGVTEMSHYFSVTGVSHYFSVTGISHYFIVTGISHYFIISGIPHYFSITGISHYCCVTGISIYFRCRDLSLFQYYRDLLLFHCYRDILFQTGISHYFSITGIISMLQGPLIISVLWGSLIISVARIISYSVTMYVCTLLICIFNQQNPSFYTLRYVCPNPTFGLPRTGRPLLLTKPNMQLPLSCIYYIFNTLAWGTNKPGKGGKKKNGNSCYLGVLKTKDICKR